MNVVAGVFSMPSGSLLYALAGGALLLGMAIFWMTLAATKPTYLPSDFEMNEEVEPEPMKRKERGVLKRSVVGLAVAELTEETAITAGIPRVRRRRILEVRGYVTSDADARALAASIVNYGPDL